MSDSESSSGLVLELAEEFLARYRNGERPALDEYVREYPHLEAEIREVLPAMAMMEKIAIQDASMTGDTTGCKALSAQPALHQLGDYRIIREVGRGGMGVVYEAEQVSLDRHVALKVLPGHGLLNPTFLERFRREAKAAARLHHTNIVPVYGTGEVDGTHYYAMQFIRGEGLDRVLHDLRRMRLGPVSPDKPAVTEAGPAFEPTASVASSERSSDSGESSVATAPSSAAGLSSSSHSGSQFYRSVAEIAVQVADALAYAHGQGVLHRDVKPSNLLLDTNGVVWVTDFGLAKADGDELTHTGDIVGTIRYMAPERFDGHSLPQSDIYSLGISLYEMLALHPPFNVKNRARLIQQVLHQPVPGLRRLDPNIPRDLETIVLKCVAKSPAERYATAERLAEDLRRFLAGQTIVARPVGRPERVWKWAMRNKGVSTALTGVAATLVIGTIVSIVFAIQANRHAGRADANHQLALDEAARATTNELLARQRADDALHAEDRANRSRYYSDMRLIAELLARPEATPKSIADRLAEHVPIGPGEPDYRDFAWRLCWTELNRSAPSAVLPVRAVATTMDSDGLIVTMTATSSVHIFDPQTQKLVREFAPPGPGAAFLSFSKDGSIAARRESNHSGLTLINLKTSEVLRSIDVASTLRGTALSADGRFVASVWADGKARIHDVKDGKQLAEFRLKNSLFRCLAVSADGQKLILGNHPNLGRSTIYDARGGKTFESVAWTVITAGFSPDGRFAATAGYGGDVSIWDATTGDRLRIIKASSQTMMALTYSPDGKSLVAVGMDGIVTLLDPAGNRSPVPLRGHAAHVVDAAYSVDGTTLVTIDRSGLVRWWDPLVPSSCRPIAPGMRMTQQLAFDAGGDWIATAERGGQFKLWDVRTGKMIREFDSGHSNDERELGAYPSIAFAANRAMIAGGDTTSIVSVWNPTNGERLWQSQAIPLEQYGKASSFMPMDTPEIKRAVAAVEFSPDGSLLAIGHGGRNASINNYDQQVHIWATGTWAKVATLQVRNSVSRICFTPDSQELIASSHDGFMRTWRRGAQSWAGEVEFAASIGAMDLSRDGNWLAIGLVDGTLILLNRKTGRTTQRLSAHGGYISGVSFSPDAATIATSGRTDRMVKIWETARLREIHTRQVRWIPYDQRFSPKGNLLAGCYPDGVWLFPAAPLEEIDRVRGLGWPGESPTLDPGSRP